MTDGSTVSALLVRYVVEAVASGGSSVERVLEQAEISPRVMTDIDYPVPFAQMIHLWNLAEAATGDPVFALHFAQGIRPDRSYPCNYLMVTSATVERASCGSSAMRRWPVVGGRSI